LYWSFFKKTIPSQSFSLSSIPNSSNSLPSSPQESINNLASHFASSFSSAPPCPYSDYLIDDFFSSPHPHTHTIFDSPPSTSDIMHFISVFSKHTSLGVDLLHPLFLYHGGPSLISALHLLFSLSYTHSIVPSEWKVARGIPLYKGKGDRASPANYRMISITSVVARLFERIILDRCMMSLLPNFLNPYQAGFRKAHSTAHLLFLLTSAIKQALGKKKCLPVCFLDISKAFDSVWLEGLLFKVYRAGIQGKLWNWIRSFLSNRSFFLAFSNLTSSSFFLHAGVPQGCVLSPFLFLIYINDLPEHQHHHSLTFLFADDIALLPSLSSINLPLPRLVEAMQASLHTFTSWSIFWRLKFSSSKSNVVLFSRLKSPPSISPLTLSSFTLTEASSYKYLGITLDNKLNFSTHADNIISSVRSQCSFINRVISFSAPPLPLTVRSLLLSKAYSILSYGLPFWSPSSKTLNKLTSLLSTPLRLSLGLATSAPRIAILLEFRLLPPSILRQKLIHSFFHTLSSSPNSPFKSLYLHQLSHPPPKSLPIYAHHLASTLPAIDFQVQLPHSLAFPSNANAFLNLFFSKWVSGGFPSKNQRDNATSVGKRLVPFYSSFSPKLPPYLKLDSKPSVCHRARLRFDLAKNNASLQSRDLVNSAACIYCPDSTDSRDHILLHCPRHSLSRTILANTIFPTPLCLSTILDPPTSTIASATSSFINKIVKARDI
jgi:hypothetical protein